MRLLLDTHALLWALADTPCLSRQAAALIGDADTTLLVSPVTAYEICAKRTLGKLPEAAALAADFEAKIAPLNVEGLAVTQAHTIVAGKLDMTHRDPFDRILTAQSFVERTPLVSIEAAFDAFGVKRIW